MIKCQETFTVLDLYDSQSIIHIPYVAIHCHYAIMQVKTQKLSLIILARFLPMKVLQ